MRNFSLILVFIIGYSTSNAQLCSAQEYEGLKLEQAGKYAEFDPNLGMDQWRFIPRVGWRKMAPIDTFYYDWLDFTRIISPRFLLY